MSSLVLAVSAIPGPAMHVYPFPVLGANAGPGAGASAPAYPGGASADPGAGSPVDGGLPGGWTSADPGSPLVRSAATFAVGRLGEELAGTYVVEDIRSAATQVVAGTNVLLRMRIAQVSDAILGARKDCETVVHVPLGARPQDQLASFTCQSVDEMVTAKLPL
jgi:hypothetical protein